MGTRNAVGKFVNQLLGAIALGLIISASIPNALHAQQILTLINKRLSNGGSEVSFTRKELAELEQHEITTSTEFTDGASTFRGPRAFEVVDMIGHAGATRLRMIAANEFSVELDIAELKRFGAILALEMDGKRLTMRDKGPIWMIYPMDDYDELQDPFYNSRLIWQLERIEFQ